MYFKNPYPINLEKIYSKEVLLFVLAILVISYVSAIVKKMIIGKWNLEEDNSDDSLKSAGKYIGILERLFVFGFI